MSGPLGKKFREIDASKAWRSFLEKIKSESSAESKKFKTKAAKAPQNFSLNRYVNVLPYDHTLVKLSENTYINANHLQLKEDLSRSYILAQGPLRETVNHFWKMVWEQNVKCIIMLTRLMEQGQLKCHTYFPGNEYDANGLTGQSTINTADYEINLTVESHNKHFARRHFSLRQKKTNNVREIVHYQFNTWPDFGVPEKTDDFLEFLSQIRQTDLLNNKVNGPVVCHCSAGIGRTGTFVLADTVLAKVQKSKDLSKIDIKQMIVEFRRSRMGLIQTPEQLRFAWKSIVDALDNERWKSLFADPSPMSSTSSEDDLNRIAIKRPTTSSPSPPPVFSHQESLSPSSPAADGTSSSCLLLNNDATSSPKRPKSGPNGNLPSHTTPVCSCSSVASTPSPKLAEKIEVCLSPSKESLSPMADSNNS